MEFSFSIDSFHLQGFERLLSLPFQDEQFCVVTAFGKSRFCDQQTKTDLLNTVIDSDQSLEFKSWCSRDNSSSFDSGILVEICQQAESEQKPTGVIGALQTAEYAFTRALLFTFLVSHIIVLVHPTNSFDLSYVRLFRTLETVRLKILPSVTDLLKRLVRSNDRVRISKEWIAAGRPCSPRILFVFEGCQVDDVDDDGPSVGRSRSQKVPLNKALQHSMEDQIYRILRKARIITNTSNNSLFAVPANQEFVYIQPQHCGNFNLTSHYMDQLRASCETNRKKTADTAVRSHSYRQSRHAAASQSSSSVESKSSRETVSSTASSSEHALTISADSSSSMSDQRLPGFVEFLMTHVDLALTHGFDDNVGRNPVVSLFELATLSDWIAVVEQLYPVFWLSSGNSTDSRSQQTFLPLKSLTDIDVRFSESRCSKALPVAFAAYEEGLPSHYVHGVHQSKLAQAKRVFMMQARGPASDRYLVQLEQDCERFWKNGHQMCEEISLTGHYCVHELHRVMEMPEIDDGRRLPVMPHSSSYKTRATCNCGRRQGERDDPFDHRSANYDFYERLEQTCCRELKHYEMAVFKPSTADSRPALFGSSANHQPAVDTTAEQSQKYPASCGHKDATKYDGVVEASSLSLALSLSQGHEIFRGRSKSRTSTQDNDNSSSSDENIVNKMVEAADEMEADGSINDDRIVVVSDDANLQADLILSSPAQRQHSTTEYLPGMVHSNSPAGLLPKFPSWSLVMTGDYSSYNPLQGLDEPGFTHGCCFLLPIDITVKVDSDRLAASSDMSNVVRKGLKLPRKGTKELVDISVRLYVGLEYECPRGHRFFMSAPDRVFKVPPNGMYKETGHRVVNHDMPLYFQCTCSRNVKVLMAQLMRVHVAVPNGPVEARIRPKVQPGPAPCPLFYPESDDIILNSGVWVLRLPYVYLGENGPCRMPENDPASVVSSKFLRNFLSVVETSTAMG